MSPEQEVINRILQELTQYSVEELLFIEKFVDDLLKLIKNVES